MVQEYETEGDRIAHLRILIAVFEQQIESEFTFDMLAWARLARYKRWLRELERAA